MFFASERVDEGRDEPTRGRRGKSVSAIHEVLSAGDIVRELGLMRAAQA
jgi:hypothetical protein